MNSWTHFWRTLIRFESDKIRLHIALRNTVGVIVGLIAGLLVGDVAGALAAALGALNVCYSDSDEPYPIRARRMLAACVVVSAAVFLGGVVGHNRVGSVAFTTGWAFGAGMLVALSTTAGNLGLISVVTLVVFASTPQPLGGAAFSGLLAFSGGLLQTALSLVFWPLRRYGPETSALADLYAALSRVAAADVNPLTPPPATSQTNEAHEALRPLAGDHSIESARLQYLLSQAERIRLTVMVLHRVRARIEREDPHSPAVELLRELFDINSAVLHEIARSLRAEKPGLAPAAPAGRIGEIAESLREVELKASGALQPMIREARTQVDALAGQLRSATELAADVSPLGSAFVVRRELLRPWRFRTENAVLILRANLHLESAAFRHAVRLAACTGIAEAVAHGFGTVRPYWLPMTVAIVLKPDFTATFSRGVLRLAGTYIGLLLATGLFHFLPATRVSEVALIAVFTFVMRWVGPANYGVLVTAVTALVVVLIAITGVPPADVVGARALNTTIGGVIALGAYWLWPTWERRHVPEVMAQLLDAYREYFRTAKEAYIGSQPVAAVDLDRKRAAGRLARSNAEASLERVAAEPGTPRDKVDALAAMLAGSHRFAHAAMALEAALHVGPSVQPRPEFTKFANDVELTLYYLAAALRGFHLRPEDLPDLREDHHALLHSSAAPNAIHDLVNVETDRIVNSLNTVTEQVLAWTQM